MDTPKHDTSHNCTRVFSVAVDNSTQPHLTNQGDLKTTVLVNEFGEIGIDNELIVTTGEDMGGVE